MKKNLPFAGVLGVLAAFLVSLSGCHTRPGSHAGAHWGYEGKMGPAYWGNLSPEFILAKTGKQQSPVDISGSEPAQGRLQFDYRPSTLRLVNNGHTIQQNYDKGSVLRARSKFFELKQFHIHSPSEHTIEGKRYDMELHFVHMSQSGEIAVVGILLQKGTENAFLKQFWNRLPAQPGQEARVATLRIDAAAALPDDRRCYAYEGSLTTPPCTEGVQWYLLSRATTISESQLRDFRKLYDGNYRPVQPLNGRTILHLR